MNDPTTAEWRVGAHYGIHIYAVGEDKDEPVGTMLTPELAERAVNDHNTELRRV